MKKVLFLFLFLNTVSYAISTGEVFYNEYSSYYENSDYEVNYCHKNHARLLQYLKENGAELDDIYVVVIQGDKTRSRLSPQNGLYDNSYAWHVVLLFDGLIYDLNAKYSPDGIEVENYFPYILGQETNLSNVLVRVYEGDMFHSFFYRSNGATRNYSPDKFIEKFLSDRADSPLITASMLKWY